MSYIIAIIVLEKVHILLTITRAFCMQFISIEFMIHIFPCDDAKFLDDSNAKLCTDRYSSIWHLKEFSCSEGRTTVCVVDMSVRERVGCVMQSEPEYNR